MHRIRIESEFSFGLQTLAVRVCTRVAWDPLRPQKLALISANHSCFVPSGIIAPVRSALFRYASVKFARQKYDLVSSSPEKVPWC